MDILCVATGAFDEKSCNEKKEAGLKNCSPCFEDITNKEKCLAKPFVENASDDNKLAGELTCYHLAYANQSKEFTDGLAKDNGLLNLGVLNECTKSQLCMEYILSGRQIEMMREYDQTL